MIPKTKKIEAKKRTDLDRGGEHQGTSRVVVAGCCWLLLVVVAGCCWLLLLVVVVVVLFAAFLLSFCRCLFVVAFASFSCC